MIREGSSPYFNKYGNAEFRANHDRYVAADHVRRSYAYVQGPLQLYRDAPETVVTSADQITDLPA